MFADLIECKVFWKKKVNRTEQNTQTENIGTLCFSSKRNIKIGHVTKGKTREDAGVLRECRSYSAKQDLLAVFGGNQSIAVCVKRMIFVKNRLNSGGDLF